MSTNYWRRICPTGMLRKGRLGGVDIGREFVKRRIIPIAEVPYKFMLLRILMDIYDQAQEIGFAIHGDSLERTFKQRPCSLNGNIDTPCISIKEVEEILAGLFYLFIKT